MNTARQSSYDVKVWAITTNEGKRGKTYTVRWLVDGHKWPATFKTRALAESFRAELLSAARRGEAFDLRTGRPVSMLTAEPPDRSWYEHACAFVDMKWPAAAAKSRAAIADALATVTPALLSTDEGVPRRATMRRALYRWAFNTKARKAGDRPTELDSTIRWLERSTLSVSALDEPRVVRRALEALALKQDGKKASANTVNRKRAMFHGALEYAVEMGYLSSNPLSRLKRTAPKVGETVDPRALPNRQQTEALLNSVALQGAANSSTDRRGRQLEGTRLVAFFACMYYAALRPSEAVELRETDLTLPDADGEWGEFHLSRSAPAVASSWSDTGRRRETRQLKHRAEDDFRIVPCHPRLVELLRTHLKEFGAGPGGRIFPGRYGGPLSESLYGRAWQKARKEALTPAEFDSPLAQRPYDLRHACVTTWLNAGVDPAQVAEWAGHSVAVLLRVYVRCIVGRDEIAKKRIERALEDSAG